MPTLFRTGTLLFASLAVSTASADAQTSRATFPPPPTTAAAVGAWDVFIVKRAAELLSTPERWNRNERGACPGDAKTFSIICAIGRANEEAAGIYRDESGHRVATKQSPAVDCRFNAVPSGREGSCGTLFDELPIFTISRVNAITSGTWRTDMKPIEVWAGTMADAESPVETEARQLINIVSTNKYPARLVGYNNDSATTFADVQKFFQLLQDRVREHGAEDLTKSGDSVEIEVYAGGKGVIRTYTGWYPVSGFSATASAMRLQIDTSAQIPPSALDRESLVSAAKIISSDAVWNRADDRKCPAGATTWSIYCAVEIAETQVSGGFHHRRPAMELVREIVDERTKTKTYDHRLMGYNNDPTTKLDDVRTLFAEAIARIK